MSSHSSAVLYPQESYNLSLKKQDYMVEHGCIQSYLTFHKIVKVILQSVCQKASFQGPHFVSLYRLEFPDNLQGFL